MSNTINLECLLLELGKYSLLDEAVLLCNFLIAKIFCSGKIVIMIQEKENDCIAILYNLVLVLNFENLKRTSYQNLCFSGYEIIIILDLEIINLT